MAKMTIEIPDELAKRLDEHPLPLPAGSYCVPSLLEATTRDEERRIQEQAMDRLRPRQEGLLTVNEAAEVLGVSRDHVDKLIRNGHIAAVNVAPGSRRAQYRISATVMEAWLATTDNLSDD